MFGLRYHHKWGFEEQGDMVPWEREIFLSMLETQVEKEEQELKQKGLS